MALELLVSQTITNLLSGELEPVITKKSNKTPELYHKENYHFSYWGKPEQAHINTLNAIDVCMYVCLYVFVCRTINIHVVKNLKTHLCFSAVPWHSHIIVRHTGYALEPSCS